MPEVSVLLPVRNAASTIGRAIASIRNQTFTDWELIIVDDGSADATAVLASEAARSDGRIRVLQRPAEGLVGALNCGLAAAQSALVARMDADDESLPERLARQVVILRSRPEIGLCACLVEFGGDRLANAGYALHVDWINALVEPDAIALNRFVESPFAHPSVMFRRDVAERYGAYKAGDVPEDYELWLRWLDAGVCMAKVPQVLLRWNDAPTRLSRTDRRYGTERFYETKAGWIARELVRRGVLDTRQIWIWGAGRTTRQRASHLTAHGLRIAGYIDIDPRKTGQTVAGVPVIAPAKLPSPDSVFILGYVGTRGARDLVRSTLRILNYVEGHDFLMCA